MATKKVIGDSVDKQNEYSSKNIKNLQYPLSIQTRPTMYVGGVDEHGLFQILKEVVDNIVDEALEGRATRADVYLENNTYTVCDDGNGIPIGLVKITEAIGNTVISMPAIQAACSIPHTSGKFDDESYKVSRGVNGLGIKLTNALSTSFIVTTFNENKWVTIEFSNGILTKPLTKCSAPLNPVTNKVMTKGTKVFYTPNKKIFTTLKIPALFLMNWAEIAAYFTPKFKVTLASAKSRKEYYFANGTLDYIDARLLKLKATSFGKPFSYNTPLCDVVLSFTDCPESDLRGFTNGSPNPNGGEHLNSTIKSLFAALTPYIKNKKQVFTVSDIKDGLVGLVNAKLSSPEFSSQTKERLTDARVKGPLADDLLKALTIFFAKNKDQALQLIERASKLNELKNSFNKSKKLVNALSVLKRKGMPADKYAPANKSTKVADRELAIVEGDSAMGSVKAARFPYQSILALRGKIQNAAKAKEKTLESEEITYILGAIGFDPKASDAYEKLQVGKIILLADPDPDGPLLGSTKVKTLTLGNPTIESLANSWTTESKPFKVFSTNTVGELVIGLASNPRQVSVNNATYTLYFDNNVEGVECTPNHKWVVANNHKEQVFINGIPFVETFKLKVGDCLSSISLELLEKIQKGFDIDYLIYPIKQKPKVLTRIVINERSNQPMYCLTVEKYGNFMVDDGLGNGICSSNCHINTLLLTLFYKYLPKLFEMGMVYVAATPEFYAIHKGEVFFGPTISDVKNKIKIGKAPITTAINHIKGWGEISAQLLKMLAMDPKTRTLIKIKPLSLEDQDFDKLMNDDVQYRRELLGITE